LKVATRPLENLLAASGERASFWARRGYRAATARTSAYICANANANATGTSSATSSAHTCVAVI
jgi:hypothetical protein